MDLGTAIREFDSDACHVMPFPRRVSRHIANCPTNRVQLGVHQFNIHAVRPSVAQQTRPNVFSTAAIAMPVQNTFTLIPEPHVAPNNASARPMTSKQVKKAHKAANRGPRLSRAEQRKIELAEQERIRKELEKERTAARARAARDRKKAKEDAQKEAKRRSGKPLVDVRPSQDTISRFVRGNGTGKKRDEQGDEVTGMPVVTEETELAKGPVHRGDELHRRDSMNEEKKDMEVDKFIRTPGCQHKKRQDLSGDRTTEDLLPEDGMDQELMGELEAAETKSIRRGPLENLDENPGSAAATTHGRNHTGGAELLDQTHVVGFEDGPEDNLSLGLKTSLQQEDTIENGDAPSLEPSHAADPAGRRELASRSAEHYQEVNISEDELNDEALEALGAMFDQPSSEPGPADEDEPTNRLGDDSVGLDKNARPGMSREFSSFAEDDLDDEFLQQLDITMEAFQTPVAPDPKVAAGPSSGATPKRHLSTKCRQPWSYEKDLGLDAGPSSPNPPQPQPPPSTQAVLLNCDDYFPSLSQQERELENEIRPVSHQAYDPLPEARSEVQQQPDCQPKHEAPKKRFFSASGSNELLSLAMHRSRRVAALEDIHEQERQRVEAGRARPHPPKQRQLALGPQTKAPLCSLARKSSAPEKENKPHEPGDSAPFGSQESEYGGDWVEEVAQELMGNSDSCLTAVGTALGRGDLRMR